jgi:hypothetical protein
MCRELPARLIQQRANQFKRKINNKGDFFVHSLCAACPLNDHAMPTGGCDRSKRKPKLAQNLLIRLRKRARALCGPDNIFVCFIYLNIGLNTV